MQRLPETDEYRINWWTNNKRNDDLSYYTDDKQDAIDTMREMQKHVDIENEKEKREGQKHSGSYYQLYDLLLTVADHSDPKYNTIVRLKDIISRAVIDSDLTKPELRELQDKFNSEFTFSGIPGTPWDYYSKREGQSNKYQLSIQKASNGGYYIHDNIQERALGGVYTREEAEDRLVKITKSRDDKARQGQLGDEVQLNGKPGKIVDQNPNVKVKFDSGEEQGFDKDSVKELGAPLHECCQCGGLGAVQDPDTGAPYGLACYHCGTGGKCNCIREEAEPEPGDIENSTKRHPYEHAFRGEGDFYDYPEG